MEFLKSINPLWITFGPVILINAILIIHILYFALRKDRPEAPEYLTSRGTSKFLNMFFKNWWFSLMIPMCKFFIKCRFTPNILTTIGFFLGGVVPCILFANGLFGFAGWTMVIGASFDMFDGYVARMTNNMTRSGAFYDAVVDRFSESLVFFGLALYFRGSWVFYFVLAGFAGSMLVSYTRAKGEANGVVCKKGSMQRPERIVYLGVASLFEPVFTILFKIWWANPWPITVIGAVVIVGVMTNATSIYRVVWIMNEMDKVDKKGKRDSVPQVLSKLYTREGREEVLERARYGYDRTKTRYEHILVLLVGGANYQNFEELIKKGELPNIQRHICEGGSSLKAVSSFPSTTGPAFAPFVTGCFPGTCDIPGVKWFERTLPASKVTINRFRDYFGWGAYALDHDISKDVRTIFEYSRKAVNVLGMVNRGAGIIRDPAFFQTPFIFSKHKKDDDPKVVEEAAFRWLKSMIRKMPDYIFYYYPTVDHRLRGYNKDTKSILDSYRRLDSYVGKMVDLLKENGSYEKTLIVLSSDHGYSELQGHFDLQSFLSDRFKVLNFPSKHKEWQKADAVSMVSGSSMANVYLKKGAEWNDWYYFEELDAQGLVDDLLKRKEIDILAGRSFDGGVVVASSRGRARIVSEGDKRITYSLLSGDPFGYKDMPRHIDPMSALKLSEATEYPDGIMQTLQLFRSSRTGDLVVTSKPGYDLDGSGISAAHVFSHGTLHSEHMNVPCYVNAKLNEKVIKTADLFMLAIDMLGIPLTHAVDGRSLDVI
ncbi:alkaline phosphatase family protein [bacterium]|nr:alkaline phosphatase family protein [bacterium]